MQNDQEAIKVNHRPDGVELCPRCNGSKFRTLEKGKAWLCRRCGQLRGIPSQAKIAEIDAMMRAEEEGPPVRKESRRWKEWQERKQAKRAARLARYGK